MATPSLIRMKESATTADRAVLVVEHGAPVARTAVIIVAPPILHRGEIHWLGVDEFCALYGVVGAHSEAGEQQVRDRSRLAGGVVLVIHEGDIDELMMEIVELVGADREIRNSGLRQAAAVSLSVGAVGLPMFSVSPTNRESTIREVKAERPLLPDACV